MRPPARLRPFVMLSLVGAALGACSDVAPERTAAPEPLMARQSDDLDIALRRYLTAHGFTGRIASTLELRLGRRVDQQMADVGRQLWFDPIQGLNDDNACAGCHSPTNGFGDTQPIAIGIDNNGVVGPGRTGPRNQRRSPMVLNTAFYPTLMWNSRFHARSGDPFDNRKGFVFPAPEGQTLSYLPHLLTAQAFIPPTERVEAAGFHFAGNEDDIRREVVRRLNASDGYRERFARVFRHVRDGAPITYADFARAIAEFEFTLVFANAPIDRYARGERNAMTPSQKRGAKLFFGAQAHLVVGVVGDVKQENYRDDDLPAVYIPPNTFDSFESLILRSSPGATVSAAAIRQAVQEFDSTIVVTAVHPVASLLERSLAAEALRARSAELFGSAAVFLAVAGLYATGRRAADQRRKECAVRLALGAGTADIARLLGRDALISTGIGVVIGVPLALTGGYGLRHVLFGVSATQPLALAVGVGCLLGTVGVAMAQPIWRMARIEPSKVLREQ